MKNNLVSLLFGALLVYHLAACHQHNQHHQQHSQHHQQQQHHHSSTEGDHKRVHYTAASSSSSNTNGRQQPSYVDRNRQQHEEPSKDTIEGDELILLGDQGSGCYDDEDCTAFMTEAGSGDDLITPRVLHIPRTTLSPRQSITTPRLIIGHRGVGPSNRQCGDDEDCVEGSGSDDDRDPSTPSNRGIVYGLPTLSPWPGNPLAMPPTTLRYDRPPFVYATSAPAPPTPRTEEVDRTILFTSKPIPPAYPPGGRNYPPARPSPPPRPTGKPVIVDVPKPMIPTYVKEKEIKPKPATTHTTYSKSSADRTALIIGLIAVILIVIVIIAPVIVFIKVRYRSSASCKSVVEDRKQYQFATAAVTPPTTLLTAQNGSGSVTHLQNGSSSMSVDFKQQQQAAKLPKKKDLKEWYV